MNSEEPTYKGTVKPDFLLQADGKFVMTAKRLKWMRGLQAYTDCGKVAQRITGRPPDKRRAGDLGHVLHHRVVDFVSTRGVHDSRTTEIYSPAPSTDPDTAFEA